MKIFVAAAAACSFCVAAANAHVYLTTPNGGEMLEAGQSTTIRWVVQIEHVTENWDLYYSVNGDAGPWLPLQLDLPAGDQFVGAIHEYSWIVPDLDSSQVRVRVVQDTPFMDYSDDSDENLTILPPVCLGDHDGNGSVNSDDFFTFLDAFFNGDADIDNSGGTDSNDFFTFLDAFFEGC